MQLPVKLTDACESGGRAECVKETRRVLAKVRKVASFNEVHDCEGTKKEQTSETEKRKKGIEAGLCTHSPDERVRHLGGGGGVLLYNSCLGDSYTEHLTKFFDLYDSRVCG